MMILKMSLTGSIVILIVCLIRILLLKAPKYFSYMLWGIVLVRLLCPFAISSPISVIPNQVSEGRVVETLNDTYIGEINVFNENTPEYSLAINHGIIPEIRHDKTYVVTAADGISEPATFSNTIYPVLRIIWLCGIGLMLMYSLVSLTKLRCKLQVRYEIHDNIFLVDNITSPFVLGIFRPRVFLPSTLEEKEMEYIILHEKHHIKRCDHLIKILAFIALMLHWFNPLVWMAFFLAAKDMEMSCDEAVLKSLGEEIKADYSRSLLSLATGRRIVGASPLAFGEGDTKARIKNTMRWKKPSAWLIILATIILLIVGILCLTDSVDNVNNPSIYDWTQTISESDITNSTILVQKNDNRYEYMLHENASLCKDFVYILNQLKSHSLDESNQSWKSNYQVLMILSTNEETYYLGFQDDVIHIKSETSAIWQTQDKDLIRFMKNMISTITAEYETTQESYKPSYDEVASLREKVLNGMTEKEIEKLRDLVKAENQSMEWNYIHGNHFSNLKNPESEAWNAYAGEENKIEFQNKILRWKELVKTDYLDEDFDELLRYMNLAADTHEVYYLYEVYYRLHDLDYFLLRYGPTDVGIYTTDDSTVDKYYGILRVHGNEPYIIMADRPLIVKRYEKSATAMDEPYIWHTYYELSDGSYKSGEYVYKYKLEITGRTPNAVKDTTYIILSNDASITYEQAWKASGLSSLMSDYFDPKDALIISFY